ncbi:MAG: hypothetical protein GWP06_05125 [Actinobacteria bacterium]|nr:hypothetical protein [Actinomycetota bacterium]
MNLLKDLREEDKNTPEKEFHEEPFPAMPGKEENLADTRSNAPLTSPAADDEIPSYERRKKRSGLPAAIIGIVFLAAIVIVYFGFFRKGKETPATGSIAKNVVTDSSAVTHKVDLPSTKHGGEKQERPVSTSTATENPLTGLGDIMYDITHAMPPGTRLNSMFLDDGVFSVEIEGSKQKLEKYQTDLKAQLPASVSLNSSRAISAGKALISGTFPVVGAKGSTAASGRPAIQKALREMASKAGVKVLDLSIGRSLVLRETKKMPVYIKLSGNFLQFQNFYNNLIQKDWNMQVSKMIIMPAAGGRANLVLRFFLIN